MDDEEELYDSKYHTLFTDHEKGAFVDTLIDCAIDRFVKELVEIEEEHGGGLCDSACREVLSDAVDEAIYNWGE